MRVIVLSEAVDPRQRGLRLVRLQKRFARKDMHYNIMHPDREKLIKILTKRVTHSDLPTGPPETISSILRQRAQRARLKAYSVTPTARRLIDKGVTLRQKYIKKAKSFWKTAGGYTDVGAKLRRAGI